VRPKIDLNRREFLLRFCQGAGATLLPRTLWSWNISTLPLAAQESEAEATRFFLHPHYRSERPLDSTLLKSKAGVDTFITEKYADDLATILEQWSASLLRSPHDVTVLRKSLAGGFKGASPAASESRPVRAAPPVEVHHNRFTVETNLNREVFLEAFQTWLGAFSEIEVAELQITRLNAPLAPSSIETHVRYDISGAVESSFREQRVGVWHLLWEKSEDNVYRVTGWRTLEESHARAASPIYADVSAAALSNSSSYSAQILHGTDYWRTLLDGACGIDVYGHNGISVADIDNDGFDDLYICQPAGLPNRLYRNRGDGTFEDITERSGLGILESTACALFADVNNDGRQEAILVRANGPLLYVNEGTGKFRQVPDAFKFATSPQGTFTGAAVADYDRDGWLDIYFCQYTYYQATGQYKYPSPYYDANNGPPNFLMLNNRDGTFRDVTAESGVNQNNTRYSFCCGWGDHNLDGWPDLYVVNDFGRKNLYRNNGDGTFTDVAAELGVEDVGAGMSVCWFDHNNDGAEDIYVANMWTAAGLRLSMLDLFKKNSTAPTRGLYQKHAMGDSLLANRGQKFEDITKSSGVGMGRWAWSSDAFDFDHDGFQDLYVTNGFVSGPSRYDLNSFFWRQIVANSPDQPIPTKDYESGWNAINELIRSDGTWSGYERNVFYANNRDGTFSDVSAVSGLDFVEDGRAFALADFDHDGRLEIALKNRNAPQVRLLKNVVADLPPSISFRLQGAKSNRDAIGASITLEAGNLKQTRMLQAGSAFLSQHTKDVLFGLGQEKGPIQARIQWPSGLVQELRDLPIDHRIWVEEGVQPSRFEPFKRSQTRIPSRKTSSVGESLPDKVETWLLAPVPAPDFSLPDVTGKLRSISAHKGKPLFVNFWTTRSLQCQAEVYALEDHYSRWSSQGLILLTVNVDSSIPPGPQESAPAERLDQFLQRRRLSLPIVRGSEDIAAIYNILYRQLFDRHRDLALPTSFLINPEGYIVKLYQGRVEPAHVERDFRDIPKSDAERLARALPFPNRNYVLAFGRNHLSSGAQFYQRGYLEQAEVSFRQALEDDPSSAEALYGIGSVYLNQNKNALAREMFEKCVKLQPSYPETLPDAWNNLGVLATREGQIDEAIANFQQALKFNPRHQLSLDNLGNAYRAEKRWSDARQALESALEASPDDAEANYSLGMVFAQTGEPNKAYDHLQRALKARPDYPEALNNLGILYLLNRRRQEAVSSFEQCIRVAPSFDQGYLNLARLYALEGAHDKAVTLLLDLLKQHPDHPQAKQMLEQLQQ
jgi:tetratricopeptide (TPR) repeat protein